MAKSQKRSSREIRKPKAAKDKSPSVGLAAPVSAVNKLMQQPKGKI